MILINVTLLMSYALLVQLQCILNSNCKQDTIFHVVKHSCSFATCMEEMKSCEISLVCIASTSTSLHQPQYLSEVHVPPSLHCLLKLNNLACMLVLKCFPVRNGCLMFSYM